MTRPPRLDGAPGHRWQPRADHWVLIWVARRDIAKKGYSPKTQRVWPPTNDTAAKFDDVAKLYIKSECQRLQDEMHAWDKGSHEKVPFDGTVDGLIRCYQTDKDSDYQEIRFKSRGTYGTHLRKISKTVGKRQLSQVKGRDLKRWYENWSVEGTKIPTASAMMTMLRIIIGFGASILEDPDCSRLRGILSAMKFGKGKRRKSILTMAQVNAIRAKAHEIGQPSLALAEALKFSLIGRPKDTLGEWLPISEPGISAVVRGGYKWLFGYDWREIDANFTLVHRLSKSIRGRRSVLNEDAGKILTYRLPLYPMIMEELARIAGCEVTQLRRDMFPTAGPLVVYEGTGLPYHDATYRRDWREIATAVGVPKEVQQRDARAGGGTDAKRRGAKPEDIQQAMGHSQIETTWGYLRDDDETVAEVAVLRGKQVANDSGV